MYVAFCLCASDCIRLRDGFDCSIAHDETCNLRPGGRCEAITGYCSYEDDSCASGRRYSSDAASRYRNACLTFASDGGDQPVDMSQLCGREPADGGATVVQLTAANPPIQQIGKEIYLEGAFGPSALVHFPGSIDVCVTPLGPNRLRVTVPSGAEEGDLSVLSGGSESDPIHFRATTFTLGLQPFNSEYEQTDVARQFQQPPTFGPGVARIGDALYLFGDSLGDAQTQRAVVNADGSLGRISADAVAVLPEPRWDMTVFANRHHVYLVGGAGSDGMQISRDGHVLRADIGPDGIGSFSREPDSGLQLRSSNAILGTYLYVVAGDNTNGSLARATINADGTLGIFSKVFDFDGLLIPQALVVIGRYLYGFGFGYEAGTIRIPINGDGTLGTLGGILPRQTGTLPYERYSSTGIRLGDWIYVIGGFDDQATVYLTSTRAPIFSDDTIGDFTAAAAPLAGPNYGVESAIIGNYLYFLSAPNGLQSSQRASIIADGTLGAFSPVSNVALQTGRMWHRSLASGSSVYVLGGQGFSSSEKWDPSSTGSFVSGPSITTALSQFAVAATDQVFLIGAQEATHAGQVFTAPIDPLTGLFGDFNPNGQQSPTFASQTAFIVQSQAYTTGGYGGGDKAEIASATIAANGDIPTLAPLSSTLVQARAGHTAAVIGSSVYLLGGGTSSIERAPFDANGTLGPFGDAGIALAHATRTGHTSQVIGSWLYVFGGSSDDPSVERIFIKSDQTLDTATGFQIVPGLTVGANGGHSTIVIGNYVYNLGGTDSQGNPSTLVERAQIQ